jgi:hypothetical protein
MKKLSLLFLSIFALWQSFVFADEILSPEEMACIKKWWNFSYENKKCEFSITNTTWAANNSGDNSWTQINEPEQEPTIITSWDIETSWKLEVDTWSSPETTWKMATSEKQNNKTTIISILVVLIWLWLIITAFRIRKLNQNDKPLS